MPIYKNISSKVVLNKIYRDLGLDDSNYIYDFVEWGGEALEFIGSYSQLELFNRKIPIFDHKGILPDNFISMQQVMHEDNVISFNPVSFYSHEKDSPNLHVNSEESYSFNPGYIITSFEEGELLISYKGIPTCPEGYPMVPDNQYFKDALFWYCYRQLILRGHIPKVAQITYDYADAKWRFYCTAARNKANYPSVDEYNRLAQTWVGLVPLQQIHESGYDVKQQQGIPIEVVNAKNLVTTPITIDNE